MSSLIGFLYPRRCPICDDLLPGKKIHICKKCRELLVYIREPVCKKCGKPLLQEGKEYCGDCQKMHHTYQQGKAVFLYNEAAKQSMYRFKYGNRREYADFYMREACHLYGKWLRESQIDCIMAVPMYRRKKQKRGYNQAELLARALSQISGIPADFTSLRRVRETVPQKELNGIQRKKNLKNAFHLRVNKLQYRSVLVIDDIYTTGSTMDAVADALHRSGIRNVYGLYVCIGQDF